MARTDKPSKPAKVSQPGKANSPARRGGVGRWLRRALATLALLVAAGSLAAWVGYSSLEASLPDVFSFAAYREIALESSRIYAAGGESIARIGRENRTVVAPELIPDALRFAIVAAEDAAFYHHPGLDLLGIARALWVDVTSGAYRQGASTITQQFAKTRFLSAEKRLVRKLKELVLARKLEQKVGKDEILALYLNEIYYGNGAYGCEEAARTFFGKSVGQVNLAEAALLAGVVNSPARFSPFRHPERARKRRAYVLDQMHRRGYIGAEDAERAKLAPLPDAPSDAVEVTAPWYVAAVRRELQRVVSEADFARGGLRVEVAMDVPAQRAAEAAVAAGLQRIDQSLGSAKPQRHYADETALREGIARLAAGRADRKGVLRPVTPGRTLLGVVLGRNADKDAYLVELGGELGLLPDRALARYVEAGKAASARYRRGDLLRVGVLEKFGAGDDAPDPEPSADGRRPGWLLVSDQGPQVALVAIEPQTRLVRALVGGDDAALHPFHRALDARRQPGSTFKTFVYGAAIEAGLYTPDSELVDERRTFRSGGRNWTPRNFGGRYDGKKHSLRDALARSINSIAVAVAERVGPEKVAAFAKRLGIQSDVRADLPLALGASSVRPIELTNAYATLAADGQWAEPIVITRVLDRQGRELYRAPHEPTKAISVEVSRALGDMLGEVVRRGSARKAKVGHPVAGKTGTTNRSRDAWFVGFSARLCAAVWVGHDDRKPMDEATGGTFALPIWAEFMRAALDRVPVLPLPRLPHVLDPEALAPLDADPEQDAAPEADAVLDAAAEEAGVDDNAIEAIGRR